MVGILLRKIGELSCRSLEIIGFIIVVVMICEVLDLEDGGSANLFDKFVQNNIGPLTLVIIGLILIIVLLRVNKKNIKDEFFKKL